MGEGAGMAPFKSVLTVLLRHASTSKLSSLFQNIIRPALQRISDLANTSSANSIQSMYNSSSSDSMDTIDRNIAFSQESNNELNDDSLNTRSRTLNSNGKRDKISPNFSTEKVLTATKSLLNDESSNNNNTDNNNNNNTNNISSNNNDNISNNNDNISSNNDNISSNNGDFKGNDTPDTTTPPSSPTVRNTAISLISNAATTIPIQVCY